MLKKVLYVCVSVLFLWVLGGVFLLTHSEPTTEQLASPEKAEAVQESEQVVEDFHAKVEPLLVKYCFDCHDDDLAEGDVNLARFMNPEQILAERRQWEGVLRNIELHIMPPLKKPQPTTEERELMATWIDDLLYNVDPENPDPGRVTLRRLNRSEYNNTIRDLLMVDYSPADDFPVDDTGYGFDNNGDVLTLSSLLMEKYLAAAEQVVAKIFEEPTDESAQDVLELDTFRSPTARVREDAIIFSTNGEAIKRYTFPRRGQYVLRIEAWAQQAGDEKAKMSVLSPDGKQKVVTVVGRAEDPSRFEFPFTMTKEKGSLAVEFINDFWDPEHKNRNLRDRNLIVTKVAIDLPPDKKKNLKNPAKEHLYSLLPNGKVTDERQAAYTIIKSIGSRAYRRPITPGEISQLMELYYMPRRDGGDFEDGLRMALTAMLVTPHFLFRGSTHPDPDNPESVQLISEHALASRMSYFLWSSMPDDELLALAEKGELRNNLDQQIMRMLKDPKSSALTDNFAGQWLQFRDMDLITPDPETFPTFSDQLRRAMKEETRMYVEHIVRNDRSILELLHSDYSFMNEPLARHYGMKNVDGMEMRMVRPIANNRGGVLRQASVLAITSNPDRTSPVKRGKWVLENILGTPPPPAPDDVPALETNEQIKEGMSFREQLELHATDPVCASCHQIMDPIGLAFEHYDAVGRWRSDDHGAEIEPGGKLNTGETFDGADSLIGILAEEKTASLPN